MEQPAFSLTRLFVGDPANPATVIPDGPTTTTIQGPDDPRAARLRALEGLGHTITLFAMDGTTISGRPWVWDETRSLWLQLAAATAATPAAPATIAVPRLSFARVFVEWSANTGVTKAGWLYS